MIATDTADVAAPGTEAMGFGKIRPRHRDRTAIVYIRQSTPHQVLENRQSTALQYALQRRATEWGWSPERVVVIDQDLGRSGSSAEGRAGFQHLLAEVGLDHVGLVLGIEMSRLARSCKDWYQLLELCALFGVLLADQEGLYDPRQYNDRLLLGLKGTLSEAELHILRQRSEQGLLNKARRGELSNHAPLGYVRGTSGELEMDPDEQVQSIVRLIFGKFEELGSVNAVLKYMVTHAIELPIRSQAKEDQGKLQWRRPHQQRLGYVLHHPIYAGAYVWGRRPTDPRRKAAGRRSTGRVVAKLEDCAVLIRDRCPAYITWQQYEANLTRLNQNRSHWDTPGVPRGGSALLSGLVVCGRCGCRLLASYKDDKRRPRYTCMSRRINYGHGTCQSFAGEPLDQLVERQVLKVLEPAALELSLSAAADVRREREIQERQWTQRLERSRYDAARAARQYHAVEPENRLVARELERRWEQAMRQERAAREQYEQFNATRQKELSDGERQQIRALADDIPALWRSGDCTRADRQSVVRHLVERVVISGEPARTTLEVSIHFAGGFVSHHELRRPVTRWEQLPEYPRLMERLAELAADGAPTANQIANALNREGWHPPKRRDTFNGPMVQGLLARRGLQGKRPPFMQNQLLGQDEWWLSDLARRLDVPQATLHNWRRRKWVHARQLLGPQGRWILWADPDEVKRLESLKGCERGWHNQPQSAQLTTPKSRTGAILQVVRTEAV